MTYNNKYMGRLYQLAAQLKGAPLKEFEKRTIRDELEKAQGSPLDKAKQAVTKMLHTTPAYIDTKSELFDDVSRLVEDIRQMSEDGGEQQ